jgi:uncharacterized protein (TIGR02996 family)
MSDENAFLTAIKSAPDDNTARLVYADWLDERGDPRGGLLRTHLFALLPDADAGSFSADRPVFCPLLGTEVAVCVCTDGAEVQNVQVAALAQFLAIPSDQRAALLEPLFENYLDMLEAVGELEVEIAGPEQVWSFVRWTDVSVPLQGPGRNRFVLVQGDPAWEGHGVEMLFRDEELICVDQASGACSSACFWFRDSPWDRE